MSTKKNVDVERIWRAEIQELEKLGTSLGFSKSERGHLSTLAVSAFVFRELEEEDLKNFGLDCLKTLARNPRAAYEYIFAWREYVDRRESNVITDTLLDPVSADPDLPWRGYYCDQPDKVTAIEVARRIGRT